MSVAVFIVLNNEDAGVDAFVNGKALAAEFEALEAKATQLGLTPLSAFVSVDPSELADLLDAEGAAEVPLEPEAWFAPEAGLATVRGLLADVEADPAAADLVEDLQDVDRVLTAAQANGLQWHFQWDF